MLAYYDTVQFVWISTVTRRLSCFYNLRVPTKPKAVLIFCYFLNLRFLSFTVIYSFVHGSALRMIYSIFLMVTLTLQNYQSDGMAENYPKS